MSILTYINKIPVYTNINEALEWGEYNRLPGYHIHKYKSVTGYMGGKNHSTMPSKPKDLPIKKLVSKRFRPQPKLGSSIVLIRNGITTTTTVNIKTIIDSKGFPIYIEEDEEVSSLGITSTTRSTTTTVPTTTAPTVYGAGVESAGSGGESRSSSGGGGGGGY